MRERSGKTRTVVLAREMPFLNLGSGEINQCALKAGNTTRRPHPVQLIVNRGRYRDGSGEREGSGETGVGGVE